MFGGRDLNGTVASSEIWDPSTGQWSGGPDMVTGRYEAATALCPSGLLVLGGMVEVNRQTTPSLGLASDEMLDASVGSFVTAPSNLSQERTAATATTVGDASDVIVIGGSDAA